MEQYSFYSLQRSSVVALYSLPTFVATCASGGLSAFFDPINSISMACSFSPSSSATRLQAVDAAAAGVKNGRVPLNLKASVTPAQRSLGLGCCRATARQEGATQDPNVAGTSCTQLVV